MKFIAKIAILTFLDFPFMKPRLTLIPLFVRINMSSVMKL